jgi:hypothetical protein
MSNIKRWTICAFLFFICFLILRQLDVKSEGYRNGCGCGGYKGNKKMSIPRYYGGYTNGHPFYYYSDSDYIDYYFPESEWYIYKPFSTYYY